MSKFRVKLIALYVVAVFPFGLLTADTSPLVHNIAFAGFFLIVILQFFIRCESCDSGIVDYMFQRDDSWAHKVGPYASIFSDRCPKCGTERV